MDEMQQITLDQWMSWKEDIREKLRETAENFVYIGYRLRQIRDSGMLDGAADIFEFAQREYGLGKSTTSRFIAINEKFSNNSVELRPEFKAIGSSKLSEMLTLPDAECELITEQTTVKEIRDLKNFLKQDPEEAAGEEEHLTPIEACIVDYFKDKRDALNELLPEIFNQNWNRAIDLMNPSGFGTHKKGIVYMFMYDRAQGVKCKVMGEGIQEYQWRDFLRTVYTIYQFIFEDNEDLNISCEYLPNGEKDVHGAYYKESKKEEKIEEQKVEETPKNQGVERSVATSQQVDKQEESNAEIVDNVPEEEAAGEEISEEVATADTAEADSESADEEDGTEGSGTEGTLEDGAGAEEIHEEFAGMNPPYIEEIEKKIRTYENCVRESLRWIENKMAERDSICVGNAIAEVRHLERHLEDLRTALEEKEEAEDE